MKRYNINKHFPGRRIEVRHRTRRLTESARGYPLEAALQLVESTGRNPLEAVTVERLEAILADY